MREPQWGYVGRVYGEVPVRPTTVLVIDDDPQIHELTDSHLEGVVDTILHAVLPVQGIKMAAESLPDLILLDIAMPQMDGIQVCRELKECPATQDIPIVFLARDKRVHHIARALDSGGSDYVTKPFHVIELQARVRAAVRNKRLVDLLKEHCRIDALTGLSNRRAFNDRLAVAIADHQRTGHGFGLLLLDLDDFRSVNGTCGHGVGDEVLRRVGATAQAAIRPYDFAARYGGDEFAIILSRTGDRQAEGVAHRLLAAIRALGVPAGARTLRITSSAGLTCTPDEASGIEAAHLLETGEAALFEAKRQGGGRVITRSPIPVTSS